MKKIFGYIYTSLRAKRSNPESFPAALDCRVGLRPPRNDERGNALWFILIAIALLGLLTVTMTRSGTSTNETGSYEQNQIMANEILRYAKSIEIAVQNLLARGCSENEISFENAVVSGYSNANSPTDNSCHVFDVAGAGLTYVEPNDKWLDKSQSGLPYRYQEHIFWGDNAIEDVGTAAADIAIAINMLNRDTCLQINQQVGVVNPSGDAPSDTMADNGTGIYTGTFPTTISDPVGDDAGAYLTGKSTACYKRTDTSEDIYVFYHVLHAR